MYGSMRACCSATTELDSFGREGIMWGDRKSLPGLDTCYLCSALTFHLVTAPDLHDARFRHAGLSSGIVGRIVPAELYCGHDLPDLKTS